MTLVPAGALESGRDEVRIDADRRDRRHAHVGRIGPDALRGQRRDLAGRVGSLERRQIHHPDGEIEREQLRLALDRALGERRRPLLHGHRVHRADSRQPRLERELEAGGEHRCFRHMRSLALGVIAQDRAGKASLPATRTARRRARGRAFPSSRCSSAHRFAECAIRTMRAPSSSSGQIAEKGPRALDDIAVALTAGERLVNVLEPHGVDLGHRAAVQLAVVALAKPRVLPDRDPRARERDLRGLDGPPEIGCVDGGDPVVVAVARRAPSPAAAHDSESRPSSQPVAIPASLSVVVEWVS